MADLYHLKILNQGVRVWNRWREADPSEIPYLHGADLADRRLSKADLSRGDLSKAILCDANLFASNLSRADLRGRTCVIVICVRQI
jgi:uncharacterized protein YjbI with pentapeptide repeats